jgi:gag-polyprotein putative aspartyl protease
MKSETSTPVFALTQAFEGIVFRIYTGAGVCPSTEIFEIERVLPEQTQVFWKKALWDTGATQCCISDRLAIELGLEAEDYVEVSTATGIAEFPIYFIHLVLPNRLVFHNIEVIEFSYGDDDDCDLIIGMDIMTQGDLSMTNQEGRTVFSFRIPSLHTLDFEAEKHLKL